MSDLYDNSRINLKPSSVWNKSLSTSFQLGRCECHRCQSNSYDESSYSQRHSFVINGQVMARKFAVTALDDLKGKLKNAWASYYELGEGAEHERNVFISQLEDGQIELEKVKAFTLTENQIYLYTLLEDIEGLSVSNR